MPFSQIAIHIRLSKIIFFCALLFFAWVNGSGQDYQCIYPSDTSFFVDEQGRILSLRITETVSISDSLKTFRLSPGIAILTPGEDPFGCYTPEGASWMGAEYTLMAHNEHRFYPGMDVQRENPFIIHTNMQSGKHWTCYREPGGDSVTAVITQRDTMNFFGVSDSILSIELTGYFIDQPQLDEKINSLEIIISKHYGFVSTVNFYDFPHSVEWFFPYRNLQQYRLAGNSRLGKSISNLTWKEIFDFQVGDEFHQFSSNSYFTGYDGFIWEELSNIKKVLSKEIRADSLFYSFENTWKIEGGDGIQQKKFTTGRDTTFEKYGTNDEFNSLPGEPVVKEYQLYSHYMIQDPFPGKVQPSVYEILYPVNGENSCWHLLIADGCFSDDIYYKGLGGPYGSCTGAFDGANYEHKLVFYKKGEETWGTPLFVNLSAEEAEAKMSLFAIQPIPAREYFEVINYQNISGCWMDLSDITGKIILSAEIDIYSTNIDLSDLTCGIYFYRIFSRDKILESGKIIKNE